MNGPSPAPRSRSCLPGSRLNQYVPAPPGTYPDQHLLGRSQFQIQRTPDLNPRPTAASSPRPLRPGTSATGSTSFHGTRTGAHERADAAEGSAAGRRNTTSWYATMSTSVGARASGNPHPLRRLLDRLAALQQRTRSVVLISTTTRWSTLACLDPVSYTGGTALPARRPGVSPSSHGLEADQPGWGGDESGHQGAQHHVSHLPHHGGGRRAAVGSLLLMSSAPGDGPVGHVVKGAAVIRACSLLSLEPPAPRRAQGTGPIPFSQQSPDQIDQLTPRPVPALPPPPRR